MKEKQGANVEKLDDFQLEKIKRKSSSTKWTDRRDGALLAQKTKDSRVVEPLINAFKDESEIVHEAVTQALAQINDLRAVEPLIQVLTERGQAYSVRIAATHARNYFKKCIFRCVC